MKRTLALLLAMMMCLSVMVACGTKTDDPAATTTAGNDNAGENTTVGTDVSTEPAETGPQLEVVVKPEYNGKTVNILCSGNWTYDEFYAGEVNGDPINDAKYTMNAMLAEMMGISIQVENKQGASGGSGMGFQTVTTSNLAGDHAYDIASIGTYDVSSLAYQGYLYDLNAIENIDLSKPWWDPRAQEQLEINGKMFYTTGDAMVLDNNCTYCILFNKDLVSTNNIENPYDLVKNNQWTLDKMLELTANFGTDLNGDGKLDDNDQYGILFWTDSGIGMIHAAGGRFGTIENGTDIVYTLNNEKNIDILTRWLSARNDDNNYFITGSQTTAPFTEGRALFYTRYVRNIIDFRELDTNFGILPYPKGDASQAEYCNTLHAYGNALMCIPDAADPEMSAAVMETLSYYGRQELLPAYYDITLVGKGIRDSESEEMLDIIFATRFFDVGTYYQLGGLNEAVNGLMNSGSTSITPVLKASEKIVERTLEKINAGFAGID